MSLVDVFRHRAAAQASATALTFLAEDDAPAEGCTYAQLDQRARAIAARLQALGLAGQRALLLYDPGVDFTPAFAGCLYAGVVAVPLYPPDPLRMDRTWPRLQAVFQDAQATAVLATSRVLSWMEACLGRLPGVALTLATDRIEPAEAEGWRQPAIDRRTLAFLQYTSGSTGSPKGVMVSHGNLLTSVAQFHDKVDFDGAVAASWLPHFHDMGLIGAILQCWYSGRLLVQLSPLAFFQRPYRWLRAIADYHATTTAAPNFAYDLCVQKITPQERATLDLSSWRIAINGSEPVRCETMRRFVETFAPCGLDRGLFAPAYGLAEATLGVTVAPRFRGACVRAFDARGLEEGRAEPVADDDPQARPMAGSGTAAPGVRIAIVDPATGRVLPDGDIGEVWLAGDNVAQGYWNRPEETRQTFGARTADGAGPYLRTGDLGFLADGELFLSGRLKDLIIVWGRNHYPQDIEQTVEACDPALKSYGGAAFAIDCDGQERLAIVHEVRRRAGLDLDALLAAIRREVQLEHELPVEAAVLIKPGTLSKTSSGKVQRGEARARFLAGELDVLAEWRAAPRRRPRPEDYVAPRTPTETLLAQAWAEVLAVRRVGVHDNFFDLGGHSLLATQLAARLAPRLEGLQVPLASLLDRPTVAQLAELIDRELAEQRSADLATLLDQIDNLSDQEVQTMLHADGADSCCAAAARAARPTSGGAEGRSAEYLILGAGPAGLQLGYHLQRAGRDYLILEAGEAPGTFFRQFPRHRKLISVNKVYTGYDDPEVNLRWDWNSLLGDPDAPLFKQFSREYFPHADKMVEYLGAYARHHRLRVECRTPIARISKRGDFLLETADGRTFTGRVLIVATGCTQPHLPKVPGIELAECYHHVSVDPEDFAGQRVLILGKGNSAFETAENLVGHAALLHLCSPHPLKMAWKTHHVGHLRAVNNNLLDTYQLKSQNALFDAVIRRIERRPDGRFAVTVAYMHADDEVEELIYDRVIACTGFRFDPAPFDDSCRPELAIMDRFPAQTSEWESTNVRDLYFAGTLMQVRDFKKKQSGFIHGFRYNLDMLARILEQKYHGNPLPCATLPSTAEAIVGRLLERINRNSSLWQQTGYMCDVVVVADGVARYYDDLTVDYAHDSFLGLNDQYYTFTMEFGQERIDSQPDVFAIPRIHKDAADRARLSTGIHPILRRYARGKLLGDHHVIEDLASEWKEEVHVRPLLEYFQRELAGEPAAAGATAGV